MHVFLTKNQYAQYKELEAQIVEAHKINTELVQETIPIYTRKFLHPIKQKSDCPIETQYKQGLRASMLKELQTCKDREVVIEKYKRKVEQL